MENNCELKLIRQREIILKTIIDRNKEEVLRHQIVVDTLSDELYDVSIKIRELEEKCKCQEK
jgi:hypothetical protein